MGAAFIPFTRCLCRRLILLGIWVVVVAIAWGRLGSSVGLEDLFWHEVWWHQALVGMAVTLLFGQIALVAYLVDADKLWFPKYAIPEEHSRLYDPWRLTHAILCWLVPSPPGDADTPNWEKLRWFLLLSWFPLLILVLLPAVIYVDDVNDYEHHAMLLYQNDRWCIVVGLLERWPFVVGMGVAAVVTHVFVRLFGLRMAARTALPVSRWPWFRDLFLDQRWLHRLAIDNFVILVIICAALFSLSWIPQCSVWISPILALCVVLGLCVGIYGFASFHLRGYRFLLLVGLLALGFVANVNGIFFEYKQRFPALDYSYRRYLEPPRRTDLSEQDRRKERALRLQEQYDSLCQSLPKDELALWDKRVEDLDKQRFFAGVAYADDRLAVKINGLLEWLEIRKLVAWRGRMQKEEPGVKPRLVVIATSGGANRAALWTTMVLTALEKETSLKRFPEHARVITGASGGMFGAAYYVATLTEAGAHANGGRALPLDELTDRVGRDALTPVAQRMLFSDVPHLFLPWGYQRDRGLALEEAWDHHLEEALAVPVRGLAQGEKEGWRPSLVLTPMLIEDGRRVLISNSSLAYLSETGGSLLDKSQPKPAQRGAQQRIRPKSNKLQKMVQELGDPSRSGEETDDVPPLRYSLAGFEFFRLFPDAEQFRLSTAVRMNATFPYVSPAVDLPTHPPRRVVDAGYYDNYGVNVAANWLYHYRDWIKRNTSGVLLIQIRDELSERRRVESDVARDVEAWRWSRAIEWLTGPAMGALNAMESVMSFRNDEQVQLVHEVFNQPGRHHEPGTSRDFFTTVIFECPKHVAYNWYLSHATKDAIRGGMQAPVNVDAMDRLKEWWHEK